MMLAGLFTLSGAVHELMSVSPTKPASTARSVADFLKHRLAVVIGGEVPQTNVGIVQSSDEDGKAPRSARPPSQARSSFYLNKPTTITVNDNGNKRLLLLIVTTHSTPAPKDAGVCVSWPSPGPVRPRARGTLARYCRAPQRNELSLQSEKRH